jgi:lactate dehydrogenase-like 2-hydroxyacid dehydrogenase/drug/metabolite transporter (DMT)-like permease
MADTATDALPSWTTLRRQRLAGIALMCAALMCFSCLDATAKWVNRSVDPLVTVWARYMSAFLLTAVVLNPWTQPRLLRTRRPTLQIIRSVLLLLSTLCNFVALQYLQLVQATSILFSTPLLVTLLAGPILGEYVGVKRLAAIGIGFIGILVITRPGLGAPHPALLLSLAGAVAYAFYGITTRMLAAHDSTATTTFYSGVAGIVLMTPLLPWIWTTPASPLTWLLLAMTGVFAGIGHWLLVLAHARAPAAILSAFIYTQIVWMLALGYVLFGDWPDPWTFAGSGIVIASGLYLLYRERVRPAAATSVDHVPEQDETMTKTEILMPGPMMPSVIEALERDFILHRLWEHADREAFLRETGPRIRGLAASTVAGRTDAAFIGRLPNLEIIASLGVGYDNVDVAEAARRGIVVTNTPDVLNAEVADLTIGLLIATLRQIPQSERYLRAGRWLEAPFPLSPTLRERTVGIVGLGRIGKAIAKRLEGFDVEIAYHGRSRQEDVAYAYHDTLVGLAQACDVLIVIAPGGAGTRHMIDAEVLKALGPNGVLINVARGSIVDEQALIEALRSGTILSAGLDVFEDEPRVPQELIDMDHVVLVPHIGSASVHTRRAMGQLVVDNLIAGFAGKGPLTPVPETPWPAPERRATAG